MHGKPDALADGLADLMEGIAPENTRLQADMRELREAVGDRVGGLMAVSPPKLTGARRVFGA